MAQGGRGKHWLVDVVVRAGVADAENLDIEGAASVADAWTQLCDACGLTDDEIARYVAQQFLVSVADLDGAKPHALRLVPEAVARQLHVFPLRDDDRQMVVATSDPRDLDAEKAVGFASGRTPVFEIASPGALEKAIEAAYRPDAMLENLLASVDAKITDIVDVVDGAGPETLAAEQVESGPVVKLTNLILSDAAKKGASDIHMEPGRAGGTVRFRVDGVLSTYMQMPMPALNRAVSRIKILGDLDIADRLRPQDGRARILVGERVCDLRISTVPTRHAEKLVVRILDPEGSPKLSELGLAEAEHERFRHMLSHREGIVVITGPTGSGKTTTLYAALQELATEEVNIMTVEDPVEYELAGITQIQVEPRQKVMFASALRAILRQDPDVILIGEIRDLETAAIAVQASLTGHLVLATLHTNEAIGVVGRLKDLGLETASIGESMRGLVAQRLLRTVCPNCSERIGTGELTPEEQRLADSYGVKPVVRPGRCDACGKSGYRGRVAAMEAVTVTSELSDLIAAGASAAELRSAATAGGMRPLREVALGLVTDGVTTLQEVERALGERAEQPTAPSSDKPHVLLVDDDSIVRLKSRAVLEKNGFDVSEANDGAAGLETIQSGTHFDLVVLDLDMPRMGGLEVLQQVRRSVATAGLPVIVLTGSEEVDSEVKLMEEGADDYIRKPIDPPKFVARVKATLRRAGG